MKQHNNAQPLIVLHYLEFQWPVTSRSEDSRPKIDRSSMLHLDNRCQKMGRPFPPVLSVRHTAIRTGALPRRRAAFMHEPK